MDIYDSLMCLSLSIEEGLPFNSSADVFVNWNESSMCGQEKQHAGVRGIRATLERRSHNIETMGRSQVRDL